MVKTQKQNPTFTDLIWQKIIMEHVLVKMQLHYISFKKHLNKMLNSNSGNSHYASLVQIYMGIFTQNGI